MHGLMKMKFLAITNDFSIKSLPYWPMAIMQSQQVNMVHDCQYWNWSCLAGQIVSSEQPTIEWL